MVIIERHITVRDAQRIYDERGPLYHQSQACVFHKVRRSMIPENNEQRNKEALTVLDMD